MATKNAWNNTIADANSTLNGGTVSIGTDSADNTISIGSAATAGRTVTIGNATGATSVGITSGTGNISLTSTGTGDIVIDSDDVLTIDSDGALEINSSAGAIRIGNDAVAQELSIGTGAASRNITLGNNTGTTSLTLNCGTGDLIMVSATGTLFSMQSTGERTMTLQPAFLATLAANREDVTGDGTVYTIIYGTEKFDQNADFDGNSTFTAPVDGRYRFEMGVLIDLTNTSSSANAGYCEIVTSNNTFRCSVGDPEGNDDAGNELSLAGSVLCDMDAADTSTTKVAVSNTTLQVDVITNTPTNEPTYFSGNLVC